MTRPAYEYKDDYYPYIGGKEWRSEGQPIEEDINPYTGEPLTRVHLATTDDIQQALSAAEEAQKSWGKTLVKEREAVLLKAADIVERRREDITKVLIEEGGNVFGKAMFEVDYVVSAFRIAAGQAREMRGETMPSEDAERISMSIRQPRSRRRHWPLQRPPDSQRKEAGPGDCGRKQFHPQTLALYAVDGPHVRRGLRGGGLACWRPQRHSDERR